jgi:Holliday junction resolvase
MKPPALKEKEITYAIKSLLNQFGIWHFKHFGGLYAPKGIPDIIGCYKGRFIGIEVKVASGRVSPDQERVIQNINDAGGLAFIARNLEDVIEKLDLRKGMLF